MRPAVDCAITAAENINRVAVASNNQVPAVIRATGNGVRVCIEPLRTLVRQPYHLPGKGVKKIQLSAGRSTVFHRPWTFPGTFKISLHSAFLTGLVASLIHPC